MMLNTIKTGYIVEYGNDKWRKCKAICVDYNCAKRSVFEECYYLSHIITKKLSEVDADSNTKKVKIYKCVNITYQMFQRYMVSDFLDTTITLKRNSI